MNDAKPLPCHRGLDADCFRVYPAWGRQALAYRLLHVFFPPWLTRRLPKYLRVPLIAEGVDVPPDTYLPPGTVVPPGYAFPTDWFSMDPPPEGIYIPPGYEFPPGWTPEDPLPDGVTIDPTVVFPPDWTPEDPLPDGVTIDPGSFFPSGWTPEDPVPDAFTIRPGSFFGSDWTPEDPLPDGVTVSPLAAFPQGWTPGDPLPGTVAIDPTAVFPPDWNPGEIPPEGVMLPPALPPEIQETGPTPPEYVYVWEPGQMIRHPLPPIPPTEITIECSAADGALGNLRPTWGEARNGTTGTNASYTGTGTLNGMGLSRWTNYVGMARAFLYFDLSALPADSDVILAILKVHGYTNHDSNVCVQEGTQGTPLHVNDWLAFIREPFATTTWGATWNTFELDLFGRLYVRSVMGGEAKFCLREYDHDYMNVSIAVGEYFKNGITYSEYWGLGPKLELTYK